MTKTSKGSAAKVAIGFCGADSGGQNILFAYHSDKKLLNIGLNPLVKKNSGKMMDWADITGVPWTTVKHRVKSISVGKGIKNLGNNFMYISPSPFNDNAKGKKTALKSVSLPSSLQTLGTGSLENHYNLRKVTIPKNVKTIKTKAFYYANKLTITFKGKKPPKVGKNVFAHKKKTGFKGTVKYK